MNKYVIVHDGREYLTDLPTLLTTGGYVTRDVYRALAFNGSADAYETLDRLKAARDADEPLRTVLPGELSVRLIQVTLTGGTVSLMDHYGLMPEIAQVSTPENPKPAHGGYQDATAHKPPESAESGSGASGETGTSAADGIGGTDDEEFERNAREFDALDVDREERRDRDGFRAGIEYGGSD